MVGAAGKRITLLGIGGCGNRLLKQMMEGSELIAEAHDPKKCDRLACIGLDTSTFDLENVWKGDYRLPVKNLKHGIYHFSSATTGLGQTPALGDILVEGMHGLPIEDTYKASDKNTPADDLRDHLNESYLIITCCGVGQGTGSGAGPALLHKIEEATKTAGTNQFQITVAVLTDFDPELAEKPLPIGGFYDSPVNFMNAGYGFTKLLDTSNFVIVIDNAIYHNKDYFRPDYISESESGHEPAGEPDTSAELEEDIASRTFEIINRSIVPVIDMVYGLRGRLDPLNMISNMGAWSKGGYNKGIRWLVPCIWPTPKVLDVPSEKRIFEDGVNEIYREAYEVRKEYESTRMVPTLGQNPVDWFVRSALQDGMMVDTRSEEELEKVYMTTAACIPILRLPETEFSRYGDILQNWIISSITSFFKQRKAEQIEGNIFFHSIKGNTRELPSLAILLYAPIFPKFEFWGKYTDQQESILTNSWKAVLENKVLMKNVMREANLLSEKEFKDRYEVILKEALVGVPDRISKLAEEHPY